MSGLTPALEAALSADVVTVFGALKIALPGHTIRLIDGAGTVTFNSETFSGSDPVFGTLRAIDPLDDGIGDQVPGLRISLYPASDTAAADLCDPLVQGSGVWLWLGAVNRTTGIAIDSPTLLFIGELDQPTLRIGQRSRILDYDVVSTMERLFDFEEGFRMADSFHQSIWPGELGFANVTGVTKKVYWGVEGGGGVVSNYSNNASGGGSSAGRYVQ